MKSLTPKHWRLYDFLRSNSERYVEQKEIAEQLVELFGSDKTNFHSKVGREICKLVQDLNDSGEIQKIILSNSNGHKLATEEEYRQWSNNKWRSLKSQIKRLAYKDYKAGLDGQTKLMFDEESKARAWYETFIKEIK